MLYLVNVLTSMGYRNPWCNSINQIPCYLQEQIVQNRIHEHKIVTIETK